MNNSGIYLIKNTLNDRRYVGSAVNLKKRKRAHRSELLKNKHPNTFLQNDVNKYGIGAFIFEILSYLPEEELINVEQLVLDCLYDNQQECYNIRPTAHSQLGFKHSKETKERLRNTQLGRKCSQKTKERMRRKLLGRPCSSETRERIRRSNLGLKRSKETKEHMRKAQLGRKHSLETKERMRKAQLIRRRSEEIKGVNK